jgi:hypothetical protein
MRVRPGRVAAPRLVADDVRQLDVQQQHVALAVGPRDSKSRTSHCVEPIVEYLGSPRRERRLGKNERVRRLGVVDRFQLLQSWLRPGPWGGVFHFERPGSMDTADSALALIGLVADEASGSGSRAEAMVGVFEETEFDSLSDLVIPLARRNVLTHRRSPEQPPPRAVISSRPTNRRPSWRSRPAVGS